MHAFLNVPEVSKLARITLPNKNSYKYYSWRRGRRRMNEWMNVDVFSSLVADI